MNRLSPNLETTIPIFKGALGDTDKDTTSGPNIKISKTSTDELKTYDRGFGEHCNGHRAGSTTGSDPSQRSQDLHQGTHYHNK